MLGLGWLAYFAFGVAAASVAPIVSPIMTDLALTSAQMGLVLGAWQLAYVFTAVPLGALVDRLGVHRSVALAMVLMAASLALRAVADSFAVLLGAVALFGFGGPVVSIGVPKLVAEWFGTRERGIAAGIYSTAPALGGTVAVATAGGPLLQLTGSWRTVFVVFAGFVLVAVVLWVLVHRDHAARPAPRGQPGAPPDAGARRHTLAEIRRLLANREVRLLLIVAVGGFFLGHGLSAWKPTLLEDAGYTLAAAGRWSALGTAAGLATALAVAGLFRAGRRKQALLALFLTATVALTAMALLDRGGLVAASVLAAMARSPMLPLSMLLLMELPGVGSRRLGTGAGLVFAAAEIGGFAGPATLGAMRDVGGSLAPGMAVLALASLAMAGVVALVRETPPGTGEPQQRAAAAPGARARHGAPSDC